jgi:hypothetical protein
MFHSHIYRLFSLGSHFIGSERNPPESNKFAIEHSVRIKEISAEGKCKLDLVFVVFAVSDNSIMRPNGNSGWI